MTAQDTMRVMTARTERRQADEARHALNELFVARLGAVMGVTAQLAPVLLVVAGGLGLIFALLLLGLVLR